MSFQPITEVTEGVVAEKREADITAMDSSEIARVVTDFVRLDIGRRVGEFLLPHEMLSHLMLSPAERQAQRSDEITASTVVVHEAYYAELAVRMCAHFSGVIHD